MTTWVPSDLQIGALAKFETFLNLRRRRTNFADREEFQRYWDQLKQRCDQTAQQRQSESPSARRAREEQRKAKVTAFYNNEERLLAYAHQYRVRFQPSTQKLRVQLLAKSANAEVVERVMIRLQEHLNDDVRAMELAERMRGQGRNAAYIQNKLSIRKFSRETITRCVKTCAADHGSLWLADALERKAKQLKRKGLSRSAIRRTLTERPADAPLVDAALAQLFADEEGDDANLTKAVARLLIRKVEPQIIIRRLQAKGFSFAAIKKILALPALAE
jgi:SOS response regulatory protein OraA/RecX